MPKVYVNTKRGVIMSLAEYQQAMAANAANVIPAQANTNATVYITFSDGSRAKMSGPEGPQGPPGKTPYEAAAAVGEVPVTEDEYNAILYGLAGIPDMFNELLEESDW